jgi:hypothetical protein
MVSCGLPPPPHPRLTCSKQFASLHGVELDCCTAAAYLSLCTLALFLEPCWQQAAASMPPRVFTTGSDRRQSRRSASLWPDFQAGIPDLSSMQCKLMHVDVRLPKE